MNPAPSPETRDFGPQPLDRLMLELGLANHELVLASPGQLTHKQVQKARKGRRLTPNLQRKVKAALEAALAGRTEGAAGAEGGPVEDAPKAARFKLEELFTYAKEAGAGAGPPAADP